MTMKKLIKLNVVIVIVGIPKATAIQTVGKGRRSLGWRTACFTLEAGRRQVQGFDRRHRKEVFEEIRRLAVDITEKLDEHTGAIAETAFRYASETWMQSNNMIRVTRNGEVLPIFYRFRSH